MFILVGETEQALQYLEEALKINDKNAETNLFYAQILGSRDGNIDEGKRHSLLGKALELDPNNAKAEYEIGQNAFNTKRWVDAQKVMDETLYFFGIVI